MVVLVGGGYFTKGIGAANSEKLMGNVGGQCGGVCAPESMHRITAWYKDVSGSRR